MSGVRYWSSPEFEAELLEWVEGALGPVRLECHKVRPWSTVWKALDGSRLWWVKQNCPANAFEATLLRELATWLPDRFVPLHAMEAERGFALMPDQGETLGYAHTDLDTWCRLVQDWAQTQRLLAPHASGLPDAGVSTLPPEPAVEFVRARLGLLHSLPTGDPRRLKDENHAQVVETLPALQRDVEALAALDLPLTLVHNDLHGGNVFRETGRVFDLGDALVSQPMADLLVPLGCLVDLTGCPLDDPSLWRVADAWIEVWSDLRPATELRTALPHAMRFARILRHQAWFRVTEGLDVDELGDFGAAGAEWLGALPRRPLLSAG